MTTSTPTSTRLRRVTAAAVVLTLGFGLTACGNDDTSDAAQTSSTGVRSINKAGVTPSGTTPTDATDPSAIGSGDSGEGVIPIGDRQDATPNVVEVDGNSDSLTSRARADFLGARGGITVTSDGSGESRAFERLCIGDIDIADTSRSITEEEYQTCRANGFDVVQFQIAADAVVLAIRSQTDVGTDCLSTDQIRAAFRNGSTITNWSQLGDNLDDADFEAGGPTVQYNAARFFGRYILGSEDPINSDFRVDYRAAEREADTLQFVTGSDEDRRRTRVLPDVRQVWLKYGEELRTAWGYWSQANAEVQVAVREQRKGIRTNRSPAARAKDDARVARAYNERGRMITAVNAARAKYKTINRRYRSLVDAQRRILDEYGRVGMFSEGFYATYENRLRPFEVEVYDGDDQPNCIFPSPQTILNGQYPLSRQLLLTVTTRSLQRPEVRAFLINYLENSQRYAEAAGIIALPEADKDRQIAWLQEGAVLPDFTFNEDGRFSERVETPEEEQATEAPAPVIENPAR